MRETCEGRGVGLAAGCCGRVLWLGVAARARRGRLLLIRLAHNPANQLELVERRRTGEDRLAWRSERAAGEGWLPLRELGLRAAAEGCG